SQIVVQHGIVPIVEKLDDVGSGVLADFSDDKRPGAVDRLAEPLKNLKVETFRIDLDNGGTHIELIRWNDIRVEYFHARTTCDAFTEVERNGVTNSVVRCASKGVQYDSVKNWHEKPRSRLSGARADYSVFEFRIARAQP